MNPNISIYRQLNLKLLVQVELSLSLLHWANMSNISLTIRNIYCNYPFLKLYMLMYIKVTCNIRELIYLHIFIFIRQQILI